MAEDSSTSLYQRLAEMDKLGPFTGVLQAGLHPAQTQQQQPQLTGYEGKGGIIASIGDKALQGFQRGAMMGMVAREAKKQREYLTNLGMFQNKALQIEHDQNLGPADKQAQMKALYTKMDQFVAGRLYGVLKDTENAQKPQKQKKEKVDRSGQGIVKKSVGTVKEEAKNIGGDVVGLLKNVMGNVARQGQEPSHTGYDHKWVTAAIAEVDAVQPHAQQDAVKALNDVRADTAKAMGLKPEQVNMVSTEDIMEHHPEALAGLLSKFSAAYPNGEGSAALDYFLKSNSAEAKANRDAYRDQQRAQTEPTGPPPTPQAPEGPGFTTRPEEFPTGYGSGGGYVQRQAGEPGPSGGWQLTEQQAKSPIAQFLRPAPTWYTRKYIEQLKNVVKDQTWYLSDKKGNFQEVVQASVPIPGVGIRYMDPVTGLEVDAKEAQSYGLKVSSSKPNKAVGDHKALRGHKDGTLWAVDTETDEAEPIMIGRGKDRRPFRVPEQNQQDDFKVYDRLGEVEKAWVTKNNQLDKDLMNLISKLADPNRILQDPEVAKQAQELALEMRVEPEKVAALQNPNATQKELYPIIEAARKYVQTEKTENDKRLQGGREAVLKLAKDRGTSVLSLIQSILGGKTTLGDQDPDQPGPPQPLTPEAVMK